MSPLPPSGLPGPAPDPLPLLLPDPLLLPRMPLLLPDPLLLLLPDPLLLPPELLPLPSSDPPSLPESRAVASAPASVGPPLLFPSAASLAPFGVPTPLGPSQPVPTTHSFPHADVLCASPVAPPDGIGYAAEPTSLKAAMFFVTQPRSLDASVVSPRRVKIAATSGDAALVPSAPASVPPS